LRLLILGASGLTGSRIIELAKEAGYSVVGTYYSSSLASSKEYVKVDIRDELPIRKLIRRVKPDVLINVVNVPGIDYCEKYPDDARKILALSMKYIGEECKRIGTKIIYTSTDYVFDGASSHLYTENDKVNPINTYGSAKAEGERIVQELDISYNIVRPSLIYGDPNKSRFLKWILSSLREGKEIYPFYDQFSCPTYVDDLAKAILILARSDKDGIYHTAGSSCVSRYQYAQTIARIFGYELDLIKPVSLDKYTLGARRPKYLCLSTEKFYSDFSFRFKSIEEGLAEIRDIYYGGVRS